LSENASRGKELKKIIMLFNKKFLRFDSQSMAVPNKIPYEDREENQRDIPFVAQRTDKEIAFSNFLIYRKKIEEAYKSLRENKQKIKEIGEQYPEILRLFNSNLKKKRKQSESDEEEMETEEESRKRVRNEIKRKASLQKFLEKKKNKKAKQKEAEATSGKEMSEAEIAKEGGRAKGYDLRRNVVFKPTGSGRSRMQLG